VKANILTAPGSRCVIGHRGASGLAPENTLISFDLALEHGADALEFDVRLTADGVAVVHHDPTLDRTTTGTGELRGLTAAALTALDAGGRFTPDGRAFPFRDRGVRIPTLREVLGRYPETPLLIELKTVEVQTAVRDELLRAGAADRVVIASFLHEALEAFRRPPFLVGASRRDIAILRIASWLRFPPTDRGVVAYSVPNRYKGRIPVPTASFLRAAHRMGRPVHVWTVDDPAEARRLWALGVSGVITNFPGTIGRHLPGR
jgi:glycerophosphoryl diester phosphodiesterase